MTISLDRDYFAVATDPLLGYCGETNSRVIEFVGLDNIEAEMYSLVLSYDDGECYETRIIDNMVILTNDIMRRPGVVDVQVYACNMQGDEYTVVRKSNILQLVIKPSLDENAKPFPTRADCLRILDKIERCASELTDLGEMLIDQQLELQQAQSQLTGSQNELMSQLEICKRQMNDAVKTAREYAQVVADNAQQIYINKSAIGFEKRNLLRIGTSGFDNGQVSMTVGENGELTLNGATGSLYVSVPLTSDERFDLKKHIPNGRYILCSNGFSKLGVAVVGYDIQNGQTIERTIAWCEGGQDVEFTVDDEFDHNYVRLYLDRDTSFDNELVLPMIRYAGISDNSWEPYKPDLQTQINELYDLIGKGSGGYNETQVDVIKDEVREEA